MNREALLYERLPDDEVRCGLCAHRCRIRPGRRGICGVRENRAGILHSLVYGNLIAENLDPIEKKPLFHVYPGSRTFSVATVGCNFRCTFCQNHDISQMPRETGDVLGRPVAPEQVVLSSAETGSRTIAYTYTEPTVFFEYALDIAKLAHARGIGNVFVTNGYMTAEAVATAAPYLTAANVDLKSFRDEFYREQCGARLQPVLDSLRALKAAGVWVEVTTLLIPGLNDGEEELRDIARFIHGLGPETPWHVSRFHPQFRMRTTPRTPPRAIRLATDVGRAEGLRYVYSGNLPGDEGEKTFCHGCGQLLIDRFGYTIRGIDLDEARCPRCRTPLAGVFS
ncbi:MAG: AmmeMemoRadiSam system radical SAM enzyme [Syntrophales bacterium]|jgi:pyruvate formate lyase activating enzyme|nr:AmmeMemoRadiSam system radical SAM enzyme [Syntrophales bacterium]MDD4339729.1 AmmeMemoRadiSam system radical SAM enzyme [Syntrophales bacterium]HOG08314.1 AmmeMemoRadiSam system radical SAM enzyme [Syntrophales bacterium]HOS77709.1 AmmeMemoRadiSam system radical SAM enzyme [Syntrophales bacterium]HPB70558.1 AmmeMemoRadiSam system radical SAM enzyme [Syntrophales bacterium]